MTAKTGNELAQALNNVSLEQLLLDPNNYRFVDQDGYVPVPEERIADDTVQKRTRGFVQGERQSNIKDLLDSIRTNGWRPVDNIQVRPYSPDAQGRPRFVVVEGNRRVTSLQWLKSQRETKNEDLGKLEPDFFNAIPVYMYDGSGATDLHYMVLMGLKHISGNKKWPAINQARYLRRLMEMGEDKASIGKRIGISAREISLSLNTLALCEEYQKSDFGSQFRSDRYNLFREVVNKPELRQWLNWSYEGQKILGSRDNLQRLFSWMSEEESGPRIVDEEETDEPRVVRPQALRTGADIRELEKIIHDEPALKVLERTRRLNDALRSSRALLQDQIGDAVETTDVQLNVLFSLSEHLSASQRKQLEVVSTRLQKFLALAPGHNRVTPRGEELPAYIDLPDHHFQEIIIRQYRGLNDVRLDQLAEINVIGGLNNAGKTSLLEAVYLLSQQSRFDALVELMQWRAHDRNVTFSWLWSHLPRHIDIEGAFDARNDNHARIQAKIGRESNPEIDLRGYLGSVILSASYAQEQQESTTHLYEDRPYETRGVIRRVLCPALFSTPFLMQDLDILAQLWNASVQMRVKDKVLGFLRDILKWRDLEQVDLTSDKRFLVTDGQFEQAVDLSTYGEGVQRMFQIGLLFGRARNGIVLIDEFENAIHASLLRPFAQFIHELAREFRVQVLLTTHSRECIQAFVQDELASVVTYHALQRDEKQVRCVRLSGQELANAFGAMDNFEPRRLQ